MADKTVSVRLIARVGQYASEMNQAAGATSGFAQSLSGAAGQAQGAVTRLGAAAAAAGKVTLLGIGAAMVVSAKAAIDFESSLTGVAKTTDLAGASLQSFGREIRDLSLDIPVNVNELNQIAELGGQLGIQVPVLAQFTETIAMLGATTNLSSQEAATGLARFANIMGSEQADIDRFASVIVELGNNFATTETEILKFAQRLAPIGQAVGVSEQGVLALGTALSSLGIPAERGSTAIQRIFLDMAQAVDEGGESLQAYADIAGTTSDEFSQIFGTDPLMALLDVAEGLDRITESGGNTFEALESINVQEQRAISVALGLANGNEVLADAMGRANDEINENNALYEEAALRFGTTESQIGLVANAFNDLRIEIGQAFLDTGAVAGFLDTMREFLGIMTENVDVLKAFAAVLGGLSVLGIANFFAGMISRAGQAVGAFRGTLASVQGLSTGMRVLRGTSLALNAAFGIVGVAATVLIGIWANQARKAAELRQAVADLNAEIEAGADPIEALTENFRDELDPESVRFIQEFTDDTLQNFVKGLAAGDEEALGVVRQLEEMSKLGNEELIPEFFGGGTAEIDRVMRDVRGAVEDTGAVFDAFSEDQLTRFVDDFRELNPEMDISTERIRGIGRRIQELHGADLSGWAERVTANMNFIDPAARRAADAARQLGETVEEDVTPTFIEHLAQIEGGAEIYRDFTEGVADAIVEFRETLGSEFDEIASSLRNGAPAWDEYGEAVKINVEKMVEARKDFIADLEAWADIQPELIQMASADTLAEIDTWTSQEKAAFARLSEDRRRELVDGLNKAHADEAAVMEDIWSVRLPGIIRDNLPSLLTALDEVVQGIQEEDPGIPVGEAFTQGITQVVEDFSDDPTIQDQLETLLTDQTMLDNVGAWAGNIGHRITSGLIFQLGFLGERGSAVMAAQMQQIKDTTNQELRIESPSRFMMEVGEQMTEGLSLGLAQSMRAMDIGHQIGMGVRQSVAMPARSAAAINNVTSTTSSSVSSGDVNISIPIINPESKDLNRAVDKARNKIQAIVPLVEGNWRVSN